MAAPSRIEFFFDFSSPYSYLAATQLEQVASRAGASIDPRPFLLGPVFQASGNAIPATVPAKGAYMFRDLRIWAADYGVGFRWPDFFPLNSVLPARMAVAVADPVERMKLSRAFFDAVWVSGVDVSDAAHAKAVAQNAGFDGELLTARAAEQQIKDALRANVDAAVSRGAFGAPTFFVNDQMFVGNDRLPFVERAAKGERLPRKPKEEPNP